jgi:hypothetical protein
VAVYDLLRTIQAQKTGCEPKKNRQAMKFESIRIHSAPEALVQQITE